MPIGLFFFSKVSNPKVRFCAKTLILTPLSHFNHRGIGLFVREQFNPSLPHRRKGPDLSLLQFFLHITIYWCEAKLFEPLIRIVG